jgi:hypothetical protein
MAVGGFLIDQEHIDQSLGFGTLGGGTEIQRCLIDERSNAQVQQQSALRDHTVPHADGDTIQRFGARQRSE